MSRIKNAFDHKKAFIGFLTAGDPTLDKTEEFVMEMVDAGAGLIELGIPFTDPIADGPVIQEANIRALEAGCTTDKIFDMVASLRKKTDVPIVFLGYLNTMFVYGYEKFCKRYEKVNKRTGKKQYVVPYFMSSHPGSTLKDAIELAEYIRDLGYMPEQVQDFYPTPSTISTCMYYTGLDPRTMEPIYVPKSSHEKAMQRALIQYREPRNYDLVKEALLKAGRNDLIGFDKKCLIPPRKRKRR